MTRASATAWGVSFNFGWFFGQKLEDIGICVVFVEQQDVSIVVGVEFFVLFFGYVLRHSRKYHAFRLVFVDDFGISCEVFAWLTFQ